MIERSILIAPGDKLVARDVAMIETLRALEHHDQAIRIRIRKRAKEHAVDEREHRAIGTDP